VLNTLTYQTADHTVKLSIATTQLQKHQSNILGHIAALSRCGLLLPVDGAAWSVWALQKRWTDRDDVWDVDSGWPEQLHIRQRSRSAHVNGQFWVGKGAGPGHAWQSSRCRLGCTRWGCTLGHLVNTIEQSVFGGDAA